jgi:hypothetical protein
MGRPYAGSPGMPSSCHRPGPVIGLDRPDELDEVTAGPADHDPAPGFEVVVDLRPEQDPAPWLDRGASWVLTRIGPFDLDLAEVRRRVQAGP